MINFIGRSLVKILIKKSIYSLIRSFKFCQGRLNTHMKVVGENELQAMQSPDMINPLGRKLSHP